MRGLLQRLRPGPGRPPEPAEGETQVLPAAEPGATAAEPAAIAAEPAAPASDGDGRAAPAGVAPEDVVGERPDTKRRGRLRRRLRHLRQVRELMLRDVGGLVYELHRAPDDDAARERGSAVVGDKLERLTALDAERRELEAALDAARSKTVLREPGVGGTCPACGEYFASDAHFCAYCGTRVDGATVTEPEPEQEPEPVTEPGRAAEPAREEVRS